ncbi:MAG TPA: hypothetical protein VF777_06920 [Phycisphaerales bacterium]
MLSIVRKRLSDHGFRHGVAAGLALGVGAAAAFVLPGAAAEQPGGYIDANGLVYVPRVVDPWKVIGFASGERNGTVYLYRLFENGAVDYITPHDGPKSANGIATWSPIPIDPKLCRPIER